MGSVLFTIGYAGYPDICEFIGELKRNGVTTLIDIRRKPYQAYYEAYEENALRNSLTREDLAYIRFYGDFGLSTDDNPAVSPDFEEIAKTESFGKGISRIRYGIEKGLVPVIMGEAMDPTMCPRGLLIGRVLADMGYTVRHIIPGKMKDQGDIEKEIIAFAKTDIIARSTGAFQMSLISPEENASSSMSDEELLAEGYRQLNRLLF